MDRTFCVKKLVGANCQVFIFGAIAKSCSSGPRVIDVSAQSLSTQIIENLHLLRYLVVTTTPGFIKTFWQIALQYKNYFVLRGLQDV